MVAFSGDVEQLLMQRRNGHQPGRGDPLALPVLVLNRLFQPVRITTVRRAMRLLYTGTAQALDSDGELHDWVRWLDLPVRDGVDDVLPVIAGTLRVPRIVHLRRYARLRRPHVRLTRRNLMLRDAFVCQYCSERRSVAELDIDHVVPRSRGGEDSWTNLVTACQPCNRRKGRRTPSEASMPLLRNPRAPRWSHVVQLLVTTPQRYEEWEPFLKAG
jgi:5-methylcytosine-specific restriction endonuclease McrA